MHIAVGDAEPAWCNACNTKDFFLSLSICKQAFFLQSLVRSLHATELDCFSYLRSRMLNPSTSKAPENVGSATDTFRKAWSASTADNNLTLHGFRRFKTTHLLNLRFLEDEIAQIDHTLYQAGLSLDLSPSSANRLGLRHSKRDPSIPKIDDVVTPDFMFRLRDLLKQYGMRHSLHLGFFKLTKV